MKAGIILVACLLAVINDARAATQPNGDLWTLPPQTAISDTSQVVWYLYSLHPDCSSAGRPSVKVVKGASHGSVVLQNVGHFTEYQTTNERYECNKKKSPSIAVVYTPEKTFVGDDSFLVTCVFPSGLFVSKSFKISVAGPQTMPGGQSDTQPKQAPTYTPPRINPDEPPKIGKDYYPRESLRAKEQGRCLVEVTVAADGWVKDTKVLQSSGYPRLDKACLDAFAGGRLIPATENGVPIEKTISVPVSWKLAN
jgi:TonB family protein